MFFVSAENSSPFLRLGDVVRGYIPAISKMKEPMIDNFVDSNVDVQLQIPKLMVVLTPCCSIKEKRISLTPIIHARKSLYENPHFRNDLTIINRKMEPEKTLSPEKWAALTIEERTLKLEKGIVYTLEHLFIYEKSLPWLPEYPLRLKGGERISGEYYEFDFRNATKVECEFIIHPDENNFTEESRQKVLCTKILELSKENRKDLRDKLADYYGRPPKEDLAQ